MWTLVVECRYIKPNYKKRSKMPALVLIASYNPCISINQSCRFKNIFYQIYANYIYIIIIYISKITQCITPNGIFKINGNLMKHWKCQNQVLWLFKHFAKSNLIVANRETHVLWWTVSETSTDRYIFYTLDS